MRDSKKRTKTANGNTYIDETYRTWLREVGQGGDRSSLVRHTSTCIGKAGNYVSQDITLSDCSYTITFDLYIDSNKSASRQLDFLNKLIDELIECRSNLVRTAAGMGYFGDTE